VSATPFSEHRSQAGAVHAMWLVSILVLWMGTLALLYVTNADIARIQASADGARATARETDAKHNVLFDQYQSLSDAVGYSDLADQSSRTNIAALQVDIDAAKTAVGVVLGDVDSQVSVDKTIKALLSARQSAIVAQQAAEAQVVSANSARASAVKLSQDKEDSYQDQIAQLRQNLQDEQQRSITQANNYDRRIQDLTDQQQSSDDTARTLQKSLDESRAESVRQQADAAALLGAIKAHRQPIAPDQPDGEIQMVSNDGTLVWIDVGSNAGLTVGTRFEVLRRGRGGELVTKGEVEVRVVEAAGSTAGLLGKAVLLDPVLPGDLIRNPFFSARRVLHYHLLGEFPLSLSKEYITARLSEMGGVVDSGITETTDVLVLGEKNLAEGEFAVALEDTDEYRRADKWGMRIVRLADLAAFLGG